MSQGAPLSKPQSNASPNPIVGPKSLVRRGSVAAEMASLLRDHEAYIKVRNAVAKHLAVSQESVGQVIRGVSSSARIVEAVRRELASPSRIKRERLLPEHRALADRVRRAGFRMIGKEEEKLIAIGRAYVAKLRAEKKLAGVQL